MNRFLIADAKLCMGCNTCMASCATEHRLAGLQALPRLRVMRNARDSAPVMCRQCEDAPCVQVCPVNAITHQDNAIVLNESLCVSCKLCGIACPFGAIGFGGSVPLAIPGDCQTALAPPPPASARPVSAFLDCQPGVRAVAVKCDLCAFSPDGPACIRTCPTNAIRLVADHDVRQASERKRRNAMQALAAELPFVSPPVARKEPNR
ncbi:formate hydrogenlyase subunit 2 [Serratia plymuthica 4Rx13]|uniref:Formate hydrogenlyase n=1 Tax=Serratia plymuthica TaxID=82996 RepID=A0A318NW41_SERPL|nr:4Fe-4S dicluster domain-containing protein [Serratia plymuthica]AGO56971.1 formate hydrogenlyase subunit 2 [Serratia plymuthica 4Rx13]PYD38151.1 formate hydrogenlyase [Serratia plymuthica]